MGFTNRDWKPFLHQCANLVSIAKKAWIKVHLQIDQAWLLCFIGALHKFCQQIRRPMFLPDVKGKRAWDIHMRGNRNWEFQRTRKVRAYAVRRRRGVGMCTRMCYNPTHGTNVHFAVALELEEKVNSDPKPMAYPWKITCALASWHVEIIKHHKHTRVDQWRDRIDHATETKSPLLISASTSLVTFRSLLF
jgi:hypothetical protein